MQRISQLSEMAWHGIWATLSFPFITLQILTSQIWTLVHYILVQPFSLLPSSEKIILILTDVVSSPLWLLQSIADVLISFLWTLLSLFSMLLTSLLDLKTVAWQRSPEQTTPEIKTPTLMSSDAHTNMMEDLLKAALLKQEASLLSKMSESEKTLRADLLSKMAAHEESLKKGVEKQLNAKVSYLQDQLRRLRSRFASCCRPPAVANDMIKAKIWEELKNLISSPEGLVVLGAAATHSAPVDKTPSNVPQFNETEIRAWVSSVFLEKDDFETLMRNMTKSFYEELERRSASMLAVSSEEINDRMAQQSQLHLAQLSKLRLELYDLQHQNGPLHSSSFAPVAETSTSSDESRIRRIVDTAIALYDADKTGMADYALESQGGQVVSTRCTETYQVKSPTLSVFGVPLWYPSNSPRTVIQPGMHPGECWAFVGSQGFLVIQLSHRIRVKGFTYEHISPVLLPTGKMDSAPKDFSVYGLRSEGDNDPILLGNYHYHQNGTSMQYFPVQRAEVQPLQLIEIQIKSNHGHINYTCMYRFRVHGSIA